MLLSFTEENFDERECPVKTGGEQFHIVRYSTVSSIVERVKYEIKTDRGLKKRIEAMV